MLQIQYPNHDASDTCQVGHAGPVPRDYIGRIDQTNQHYQKPFVQFDTLLYQDKYVVNFKV